MPEKQDQDHIEEMWRNYLLTGELKRTSLLSFHTLQNIFRSMPRDPRCAVCYSPFAGIGGTVSRVLLNRRPSIMNPQLCDACERYAREHQGGAEIELSMLFADIRGSTTIAESISPAEFSELINRFYQATTGVLVKFNALIEKLIGDEVAGPGEIVVSEDTWTAAEMNLPAPPARRVQLKGRSEGIDTRILGV